MTQVSIIIPFYNKQDTLKDCINSALNQISVDSQIILVDNNSSDKSNGIAKEFANASNKVTLLHAETQGSSYARNAGVLNCTSTWIQFLDADDTILPKKIVSQLETANEHVDIICSPHTAVEENNKHEKKLNPNIWMGLIEGNLGVTSSMLFRRTAIVQAGLWSHSMPNNQEYELIFRMLKAGSKILMTQNNYTIKNNLLSDSITSNTLHLYPRIAIALREEIEAYLEDQSLLDDKLRNALYRFYYDKICWLYKFDSKAALGLHKKHFSLKSNRSVIPFPNNIIENVFGFTIPRKISNILGTN